MAGTLRARPLDRPPTRFTPPGVVLSQKRLPAVSLPRALSKLGHCSRTEGERLVRAGRVRVNGRVVRDVAARVDPGHDQIDVDDVRVGAERKVYIALNKPRGLVTTRRDPHERDTVYQCLEGADLPYVAPVGRLDKASEGLLLFTNDSRWGARLLEPESHVDRRYHVQIDRRPDDLLLARMREGIDDEGDWLSVKRVSQLRHGEKNAWLDVVLDEGKNRHIRRLLEALGIETLRLVRVAIGPLELGTLAKGEWRHLTDEEVFDLEHASHPSTAPAARRR